MNIERRNFVIGFSAAGLLWNTSLRAAPLDDFDAALDLALSDPETLAEGRANREGAKESYDYYVSRAIAPRPTATARKISERAVKLITAFEVTSPTHYDRKYQQPLWPGGSSGVTIGVGYDIGYVTPGFLSKDWSGIIPDDIIKALSSACKITGTGAQKIVEKYKSVSIPWKLADLQFRERLLPLYISETLSRLPNADKLSDDSLGAMVSLVYNRGGSFLSDKSRRREMKRIYYLMQDKEYEKVPEQIIAMKRLWPDLKGLRDRRDLEAALFKAGLKS